MLPGTGALPLSPRLDGILSWQAVSGPASGEFRPLILLSVLRNLPLHLAGHGVADSIETWRFGMPRELVKRDALAAADPWGMVLASGYLIPQDLGIVQASARCKPGRCCCGSRCRSS